MSTPDSISITKDFISFFWIGDMNACRSILADDFTFVGPFVHNAGQGIAPFMDFRMRVGILLEHLSYETESVQIIYGDTHTAITLASIDVRQGKSHVATLRFTFIWRITVKGFRLAHLHMSIPIQLQADAYHNPASDLVSIAPTLSADTKPVFMKDSSGKTHLVNLGETTYLEAQHQYTMVNTAPEPFRVRESLTSVMGRFPSYFVRVHRSYVVNAFLVASVSKDVITMKNGDEVPVPAKRAAAVRKLILDTISESLMSTRSERDAASSDSDGERGQGKTPPPELLK